MSAKVSPVRFSPQCTPWISAPSSLRTISCQRSRSGEGHAAVADPDHRLRPPRPTRESLNTIRQAGVADAIGEQAHRPRRIGWRLYDERVPGRTLRRPQPVRERKREVERPMLPTNAIRPHRASISDMTPSSWASGARVEPVGVQTRGILMEAATVPALASDSMRSCRL